jgi:hypothetical protein
MTNPGKGFHMLKLKKQDLPKKQNSENFIILLLVLVLSLIAFPSQKFMSTQECVNVILF